MIRHGRAEMLLYNESMIVTGQRQKNASTLTNQVFHAKTTTILATWNVWTLNQYGHSLEHILEVCMYLISPVTKALIGWKRFQTRHAKVTIIQADVPTMEADDSKKDNFYKILENVIDEIRRHDIKPWMGDFGA